MILKQFFSKLLYFIILLFSISIYSQTLLDSDGDGVANIYDLDDDNDGILDTEECPGELITNGTFTSNLSGWTAGNGWVYGSANGGMAVNNINNLTTGSILSQTLSNLNQVPNGFVSLNIKLLARDNNDAGNTTATLQVLLNGVVYATFTNSGSRDNSNITLALSSSALSNFTTFGTGGVVGYAQSTPFSIHIPYTGPNSAVLSFNMISGDDDWGLDDLSIHAGICDDDNDGIPNYLDLDSDGDGCPDAIEGAGDFNPTTTASGSISSQTPNINFGTAVNINTGIPTAVGVGQAFGYSQSVNMNACKDKDGDGIIDNLDLDSDNDGVLDIDEGSFCGKIGRNLRVGYLAIGAADDGLATNLLLNLNNYGTYGTYKNVAGVTLVPFTTVASVTEAALISNNIDVFFVGSTAVDNNNATGASTTNKAPTSVNNILTTWAKNTGKVIFAIQNNAVDFGYVTTANNTNNDVPLGTIGNQVYTNGYWPTASLTQSGTVQMTISSPTRLFNILMVDANGRAVVISDQEYNLVIFPDATIYIDEANEALIGTNNNRRTIADTWAYAFDKFVSKQCVSIDTDNDTVPNHLDLDSDGDGCSDAFEAGATNSLIQNFAFVSVAGASTDLNSDGLADIVDGTPLNSIPDYVNTYEIAVDTGINKCLDSDGDGVLDTVDLDDDNDGILDTAEGFACGSLNRNLRIGYLNTTLGNNGLMINMLSNVANFSYSGTFKKIPGITFVPYTTAAAITEAQLLTDNIDVFYAGSSANDSQAAADKLSTALNTIILNWVNNNNKSAIILQNNATDYGYQLTSNNVNNNAPYGVIGQRVFTKGYWPETVFAQSGTVQMTIASQTNTYETAMSDAWGKATFIKDKSRKIVIIPDATIFETNVAAAAINNATLRVAADVWAYAFDVFLQGQCSSTDTDGDGIPDYLDLDSDGDGCPDAIEGGSPFTNANLQTATGNLASQVPNKNLGNAVGNTADTMGIPTIAGTGQSIGASQDNSINLCADNDGDGVPDDIDLDNDNDGILDTVECGSYDRITSGVFPITGGNTNTLTDWIVGGTYAPSGAWVSPTGRVNLNAKGLEFRRDFNTVTTVDQNLTNVLGKSTIYFNDLYWNKTPLTDATATSVFTVSYAGTIYATITTSGTTPTITTSNGATSNLSTLQTITTGVAPNGTASTPVTLGITFPSSVPTSGVLLFTFTAGTSVNQVNDLGFRSVSLLACKDTDADGIPDYLDLDSDGDGCPDAIEGGGGFTNANLQTATGNLASQIPNKNLGNTVGNTATTMGVPTIAGTGQSVGISQNNNVNKCTDSDGDGILDICDLDSDNDGILDVNEKSCALSGQTIRVGYIPNSRDTDTDSGYTFNGTYMSGSGALKLSNLANFGPTGIVNANIVLVNMGTAPITKAIITSLNLNVVFLGGIDNGVTSFLSPAEFDAIKDWSDDSPNNFVVATQFQTAPWGSTITSLTANPNLPTAYGSQTSIFNGPFGNITSFNQGGGFQGYFNTINSLCTVSPLAVNGNTQPVMYIDGIYNDLMIADVDILTTIGGVTAGNAVTSNNDKLFMNIWAFVAQQSACSIKDTDADGIPDYLDLDSDGDGCPDAIEGGGGFTNANLQTATGNLASQVPNKNLGNTVGNTATTMGVPTIAGTGQSIGNSNNSSIQNAQCANAFGCTGTMYLSQTDTLYTVNNSTNPFTYPAIGTAAVTYNAIGINPLNGLLYGMEVASNNLLVVNTNGSSINLGPVTGLPTGITYNAGEIDNLGNYYVKANSNNNQLYKINLTTKIATVITLSKSINVADLGFNTTNSLLYTVSSTNGQLVSINPATGNVVEIGSAPGAISFGALFGSSTGEMYGSDNAGGFYQFNLVTGQKILISSSPASNTNDGAHCVTSPITFNADLAITKTDGSLTYTPGNTVQYTIVVTNNGPFGVLNASVTDPLPAGILAANVSYTAVASAGSTTNVVGTQTGAINDLVGLPNGGTVTYTVNINVPSSFTGNLVNTATVTAPVNITDPNLANNTATDTNTLGVCYENPGLVAGQTYPVKHGITTLLRAGSNNGNWPMSKNSAYTALESKNKGFVITRNSSPETTIAIPVVGMMVFDTDENSGKGCLKVYTGSAVGEGWKCFITPACP